MDPGGTERTGLLLVCESRMSWRAGLRQLEPRDPSSSWPIERSLLEILKSHFRCNSLFREELMMCTNDPEAGRNYCSRRFFIFRVKNNQIHQKIDLGAVLALDAKRRMRATIFEKKNTFLKSKISEINL